VAVGLSFLARAIGDRLGDLTQGGLGVASGWPSWLSPLGWGQQIHPFTQGNWWVFGLFAALWVALVGCACVLLPRRDLGMGLLPARRGPAKAARSLLSPTGLAWRLQRGLLRGWAIAIAVLGVTFGVMAKEFARLLTDNEQLASILQQLGGSGAITDVFFSAMFRIAALVITGYALQALLRMHTEESEGRLEGILATSVSRPRWMVSHLGCVLLGAALLAGVLGASTGAAYVVATGTTWGAVPPLLGAALAQLPAVLALMGFASAAFGLFPRGAVALSWGGLLAAFVAGQMGMLLKLPRWVINLSPFAHAPAAPAEGVTMVPLAILLAIAVALCIAGIGAFRRRNYAF
jgi:ABC-2 type transport system permease protein